MEYYNFGDDFTATYTDINNDLNDFSENDAAYSQMISPKTESHPKSQREFNKILKNIFLKDEEKKPFGKTDGKIQTWRDPYDSGFSTTRARTVQFEPGVTVLVGCNGSGKSTLLHNIKSVCNNKNVACLEFDNLKDGGHNSVSSSFYFGDYEIGAALLYSSEGETLSINISLFARDIGKAVHTDFVDAPEIWILMDASDSGLSIDNVIEIKELLFKTILNDLKDKDVYIVAASNEYELAKGEKCLNVMSGKYLSKPFKDYDEYRQFILDSRKKKDIRMEKAYEKQQKA